MLKIYSWISKIPWTIDFLWQTRTSDKAACSGTEIASKGRSPRFDPVFFINIHKDNQISSSPSCLRAGSSCFGPEVQKFISKTTWGCSSFPAPISKVLFEYKTPAKWEVIIIIISTKGVSIHPVTHPVTHSHILSAFGATSSFDGIICFVVLIIWLCMKFNLTGIT